MPVCEVLHAARAEVTQPTRVRRGQSPARQWVAPYGGVGALPKIG